MASPEFGSHSDMFSLRYPADGMQKRMEIMTNALSRSKALSMLSKDEKLNEKVYMPFTRPESEEKVQ